jgi:hypothetical protein
MTRFAVPALAGLVLAGARRHLPRRLPVPPPAEPAGAARARGGPPPGPPDAAAHPVPAFEVAEIAGTVEAVGGSAPRPLASASASFEGESNPHRRDDGRAVLRGPTGDELALRERGHPRGDSRSAAPSPS